LSNILILGATGSLARVATALFIRETDARLTLLARSPRRLAKYDPARVRVIEGDVMNLEELKQAMESQDVVYANLAGNLEAMAKNVVRAMSEMGLRRLVWISSMGIYDEVPGENAGSILDPYRKSAAIIEASELDYTILRPGWFNNVDEVDYEITQKGEPFRGHDVSRKSLASLIVKLAMTPGLEVRKSLGVNRPV